MTKQKGPHWLFRRIRIGWSEVDEQRQREFEAVRQRSEEAIARAKDVLKQSDDLALRRLAEEGIPLSAFVSYSFDTVEAEAAAQAVERFLKALNVHVTTGRRYQPRRVSDKVDELLAEPFDLVVFVLLEGSQSMWTRDEIATARSRGAHFVPLVARGQRFETGLFGDSEWVRFETGHIGDTFPSLAEAVRYVRRRVVEGMAPEELLPRREWPTAQR